MTNKTNIIKKEYKTTYSGMGYKLEYLNIWFSFKNKVFYGYVLIDNANENDNKKIKEYLKGLNLDLNKIMGISTSIKDIQYQDLKKDDKGVAE